MCNFMKTLIITTTCLLITGANAIAADVTEYIPHKVIVQFEDSFSTDNPPKHFCVIVNSDYNISNCRPVEKGTKLYIDITKVSKEKVGKINASAEGKITKAYIPSKNITIEVTNPNAVVKFSQYEQIDKKDKALDVGISVANHFVSNITYPAHFAKGIIKNDTGNRLKSGAKEMYNSSVLSYTGKGKPLVLKAGDLATLTFFTKNIKPDTNIMNENIDDNTATADVENAPEN